MAMALVCSYLAGLFASFAVKDSGHKQSVKWLATGLVTGLNAWICCDTNHDMNFLVRVREFPWEGLTPLWTLPWTLAGCWSETWLFQFAGRRGKGQWEYIASDGTSYPAESPRSNRLAGSAWVLVAVCCWMVASSRVMLILGFDLVWPLNLYPDIIRFQNSSFVADALILFSFGFAGTVCRHVSKRILIPTAEELLRKDARSPVLYLRSFQADGTKPVMGLIDHLFDLPTYAWSDTVETNLARVARRLGPFIAVGRPGEVIPEMGAARMYLMDEHWQPVVADLIIRCQLVILHAGPTPGLQWEMRKIRETIGPERVVIFIPLGKRWWGSVRQRKYQELKQQVEIGLSSLLPKALGRADLLFFLPDRTWEAKILSRKKDIPQNHPLLDKLSNLVVR